MVLRESVAALATEAMGRNSQLADCRLLMLGVAGKLLFYDLLKAEFFSSSEITTHGTVDVPGHALIGAPLGTWKGELLIDWGLALRQSDFVSVEACFRRALEIREANNEFVGSTAWLRFPTTLLECASMVSDGIVKPPDFVPQP